MEERYQRKEDVESTKGHTAVLLKDDDDGVVENFSLDVWVQCLKLRLPSVPHIAVLGSLLFDLHFRVITFVEKFSAKECSMREQSK